MFAAPECPPAIVPAPTEPARHSVRSLGAALLPPMFEVDLLAGPTCCGPKRMVAFSTRALIIDLILKHFRTRASLFVPRGARHPPSTRDRQHRAPRDDSRRPLRPLRHTPTPDHVRGSSVWAVVPRGPPIGPRRHRLPRGTAVLTFHDALRPLIHGWLTLRSCAPSPTGSAWKRLEQDVPSRYRGGPSAALYQVSPGSMRVVGESWFRARRFIIRCRGVS